jgi:UDP-3-O-[3-hydroxymyristoyl] glucosamine N-acyltransferase
MTMVTKSITERGAFSSGTTMMSSKKWKRAAVRFSQLDDIASRLRKLESQ